MNVISNLFLYVRARWDGRTDQYHEATFSGPDGTIDVFAVSPFVNRQLSLYEVARKKHCFRKRRFSLVYSKNGRFVYPKYLSFHNTLSFTEARVSQIQARIRMHFTDFNQQADILEAKRSRYQKEDSPEYVQFCQDEYDKQQLRFLKKVKPLYLANISLLSNSLDRLERLESRLQHLLNKRFNRINQYHAYLSRDPKLPKFYYGHDRMAMIADTSTTECYQIQKEQMKEALNAYQEEYKYLFG